MSDAISFTVPGAPVSVNHYKSTRFGRYYVTPEAKKFKADVALCARNQYVAAKEYEVEIHVYLGHKQRGDCDNFLKVAIDSLVAAGVIHSDSAVTRLVAEKGRDAKNPRTCFTIRSREAHE